MKKKKLIISSTLAIAVSISLISGATYSLFTSESTQNITVTSGNVTIEASFGPDLTYTSLDKPQEGKFANGGTAKIDPTTGDLELKDMTPGDKLGFTLNITNTSSVKVKYRVRIEVPEDDKNFKDSLILSGEGADTWTDLNAKESPASSAYSLLFKNSAPEVDNEFKGLTKTIKIIVEAHQGNDPELKVYTMSFNPGEGVSPIAPIKAMKGEAILKPSNPEKEGFNFLGWSENPDVYEEYIFPSTMPNKDVTLYAHYKSAIDYNKDAKYLTFTLDDPSQTYTVTGTSELFTTDKPKDILIPKQYNGKDVTAIGANAFSRNETIENIVVSNTITSIGAKAFAFTNIKSITFEENSMCESIGVGAIKATNITSFTFPEKVSVVPKGCFSHSELLSSVTMHDGITSILNEAFCGCIGLTGKTIYMPLGLNTLENFVFDSDGHGSQTLTLTLNFPKNKSEYDGENFRYIREEYDKETAQYYNSNITLIFADTPIE